MVSLPRSGHRHPLTLATAVLFAALIATPFTAPFSSCSPATLFARSPDANPATHSTVAVVVRDRNTHRSDRDATEVTEDQFNDEAAIMDVSVEETAVSSVVATALKPSNSSVTRAIPAVLRV